MGDSTGTSYHMKILRFAQNDKAAQGSDSPVAIVRLNGAMEC